MALVYLDETDPECYRSIYTSGHGFIIFRDFSAYWIMLHVYVMV